MKLKKRIPYDTSSVISDIAKKGTSMKHQNLFVSIVGIAAWVHSTWAFATIIGGAVPSLQEYMDIFAWLYWFFPGAAAAAAVDVGLISLAAQFRTGRGNRAMLVTFGVLSFISYVGQASFSLSHGGHYSPAPGLSAISTAAASVMWELLIWTLPSALPVTLILWAWSDTQSAHKIDRSSDTINVSPDAPTPVELPDPSSAVMIELPARIEVECPNCQWAGAYDSRVQADMALRAHTRHCKHNSPSLSVSMPAAGK